MILSPQQKKLFEFVTKCHGTQVRKYTKEPYTNHLLNVAQIVVDFDSTCVEIALCHDLFEDTDCNFSQLFDHMVSLGYSREYSYDVCTCVQELTDVYTAKEHPYLNRRKRKKAEAKRLSTISSRSKTVKYADLIDNTKDILTHDKDFGEVYIVEAKELIDLCVGGNVDLYKICRDIIVDNSKTF